MEPYRHDMDIQSGTNIMYDIVDSIMEIYEELDGAKKYIKFAIHYKGTDKSSAENMVNLSAQELQHADVISSNVNRMMMKLKDSGNMCYDVLKNVWDHLRERQMGYAAWIKQMHENYKQI